MLKKIKNKYLFVVHCGVNEQMTLSLQKKIILTNQISLLIFLVITLLLCFISIVSGHVNYVMFLLVLSLLTIPYINYSGYYKLTSLTMSIVFPINILIFSTILKKEMLPDVDALFYYGPRLMFLGALVIPLILIDISNKWILYTALLINLCCMLLYDYFNHALGVGFNDVNITNNKYDLANFYTILPYLLILLGFLFLQNINNKYENIVNRLINDLQEKNVLLTSQKEEILSQRDQIEEQKIAIEKIYTGLKNSINYAEQIQRAVLPKPETLSSLLHEHFVLFKPKDVVSGDFYLATNIGDELVFTVADCTGHGVPGGFMSMLGMSFLNEIIRKKNYKHAGEILDFLRTAVIEALQQQGKSGEQKDGMDIALCMFNKHTCMLQYSGAKNSLYIVGNNKELREIKADKQPVSIYENMIPFSNHSVALQKGDMIYLCSDGFVDQFGGSHNKKFMSRQLKLLLTEIADKAVSIQKEILERTFENWKGVHKQTDDVTILGIKV